MNAERLLKHYERIADAPDAIARLRRFILDLAVRGKLVPQDPNDEPASELLKRIAKEKARLVKAGEISQSASKPVLASDLAFDIPAYWHPAKIENVLDELQTGPFGSSLHQRDYRVGGTPVINPASIQGEQIVPIKKMAVDAITLERLASFKLRRGDVVMARRGEMGRCAIVTEREAGWLCGTGSLILRPSKLIYSNFLVLLIGSPFGRQYLGGTAVGTTMQNLNQSILLKLPFGLPPLAEQRRIVAKVDELMDLCDRLEAARTTREATRDRLAAASLVRLNAPDPETFQADARFALDALPALTTRPDQIKALRQTILNLAVRGKLVPQDPNDEPAVDYLLGLPDIPAKTRKLVKSLDPSNCGGDLPASWAWLPLGGIISGMDAGWSPQCENHPRSTVEEWGVLKTTAVQALSFDSLQHKLLPAKLKPRPQYQAEVGDILVTRAGPKNRVGISCVVDVPCPRLMISDKLIRFHALGELSARYIALTLNAGYTIEQVEAAKSGMAVMQMNISQDKLRAVPIPLPPLAEQHRIVAKVEALMALCDRLEASLTAIADTRRRLLDALLAEALAPVGVAELEAAE